MIYYKLVLKYLFIKNIFKYKSNLNKLILKNLFIYNKLYLINVML